MSTQASLAYQIRLKDTSRSHLSPTLIPSNLHLATVLTPVPGPSEVLIRIRAAALNYRDILVQANSPLYPQSPKPNLVPCADGAGTIVSVGPGSVWAGKEGSAVVLVTNDGWMAGDDASQYGAEGTKGTLGGGEADGTLRQYAVVRDELVLPAPRNLGFEETASMVACAGTAVHALESIKIREGMTVLT
jgi:NADPH:quinone reductase-like Zn-dependent oxidoreductase